MPLPDYQSLMLPLLKLTGDRKEHSLREIIDTLAGQYHLTEQERRELLPSGRQAAFENRVGWARTYMRKAGLLIPTRRGCFQITERGLEVLKQNPKRVNIAYLEQFPEFVEFRQKKEKTEEAGESAVSSTQTPEEAMGTAYQQIRQDLASDLLQLIKNCSPKFFEQLVIDLLVQMGYGGTRKDAGEAIGGSGDEGIDGIIKEDRLGLDVLYIQAKRWQKPISQPEIQQFVGALSGRHASKGVFITTSSFTQNARAYVGKIAGSKIILIDGDMLAQLMIDFNVGVAPVETFELKRVDSDYFIEE